jgi:hypothetical protein
MELSDTLTKYLVSTLDGFSFERLVQRLLAARDGEQFVSLGGVKDGGADGFIRSVLEEKTKATSFVQMSIQEDATAKVRQTVLRLREFGREVKTLSYWTSRKLDVDVLEEKLSAELDVIVRIRDWDALMRLLNTNERTKQTFLDTFRREIFELSEARQVSTEQGFDVVSDPSVYVFLQVERSGRSANGGLVAPTVDSLIYWSLRETDPDNGIFLSRAEIKSRITSLLPSAAATLIPNVDERLKYLSTRTSDREQRVRHYKNNDSFCLPHVIRISVAESMNIVGRAS